MMIRRTTRDEPMANGAVNRCVCMNVTFEELRAWADARGVRDIEPLRERFGCGRGCSLCVPYIRAMLTTGRASFAVDDPALMPPPSAEQPPTL